MKHIGCLGVVSVCFGCSSTIPQHEREQAAGSAAYSLIEQLSSDRTFHAQLAIQREAAFRDGPEQIVAVQTIAPDHVRIRYSEGIGESFYVQYHELYQNMSPVEDETYSDLARYKQSTFSSTECPNIVAPLNEISRNLRGRLDDTGRPVAAITSGDATELCVSADGPSYRLVMYTEGDTTISVQPLGCSDLKELLQTAIDKAQACAIKSTTP